MIILITTVSIASAETVNYTPGTVNGYEGNVTLKKVDKNSNVLNGAEFQLLKGTTPVSVVKVSDGVYKKLWKEKQMQQLH